MVVVAGGSRCKLITGFTAGEDTNIPYGKHHYLAQTFTITKPYIVWRCRLKSFTTDPGEFSHYGIRATDALGKPAGPDIDHTTLSPINEPLYSPGKWMRFDFNTTNLLPPGTYALIASVPGTTHNNSVKLRADGTSSPFPSGKAWKSDNDGVDWTEIPDTDFVFEVWGWEPPPVGDPTPVISNWAPLDVVWHSTATGVELQVRTDIPCHLYMRWTNNEPLKHPSTEYRRGLLIQTGTLFCFTAFHENEQIEAGDTLVHTFIKDPWPICETRWFYFIGTKQLVEQPSASPIFEYHNKGQYTLLILEPWRKYIIPMPSYALLIAEPWTS